MQSVWLLYLPDSEMISNSEISKYFPEILLIALLICYVERTSIRNYSNHYMESILSILWIPIWMSFICSCFALTVFVLLLNPQRVGILRSEYFGFHMINSAPKISYLEIIPLPIISIPIISLLR